MAATKEQEKACQENAEIVTDDEVDDSYEEEKAKLTPSTIPNEGASPKMEKKKSYTEDPSYRGRIVRYFDDKNTMLCQRRSRSRT